MPAIHKSMSSTVTPSSLCHVISPDLITGLHTHTLNVKMSDPVNVNRTDLQQTNKFTYLDCIIKAEGSTKEDIHSRLGKARSVFREMNNVWRSTQYSINTKLKLYQSCVVSTLLYGSECWRITETDLTKLRSFHTNSVMHRPPRHRPLAYYKPKCPIDLADPGQFDLLKFGDVDPSPIAISVLKPPCGRAYQT